MKRRFSAILLLVLFSALFACKTQVTPGSIEVQGVVMNKLTTSILVGATETLSVVVTPADAENKAVVWSTSAAAVATVSAEGVVTGLKEGTATITATTQEGGHTATCVVAVSSTVVAVTGVTLNHETATMVVGTTSALAATVVPVAATNQNIDWSTSDATVATVSAQGVVTGLKEGTATITATTQDGGYKTSCVVRVSNTVVAVTGVALNHETATMVVGATSALAATVAPVAATNQDVSWSTSDEAIATVSAEGAVTAVAEGTATITATTQDGGYTATCVVTVSNAVVLVAEVTLDQSTLSIESGSTATLVAAIAPQDATNKNVDWSSSDLAVATVSAEGVVTGVKGGTATITVTTQDGTKTATCEVTVADAVVAVAGVTLDQSTLSIASGSTATLVAAIAPQDATNKNVDWSTSDLAVATVSTEGVVTAVSEGTATITATTQDGSKTATCAVTVTSPVSVTGVTLNEATATVAVGGTTPALVATVVPVNASNKKVSWSTSNAAVATVSAQGVVTGVAEGSATITVTTQDGTQTATCTVTAVIAVTGVTLDRATATVAVLYATPALVATVSPANATNKDVAWSTSDEAIATVSAQGVVTGVGLGSATITATTEDGTKTATCVVTPFRPINPPGAGDYIAIDGLNWTKGSLIAKSIIECKVGAPTDYGLYFAFGSLTGWSGGATGDGQGVGDGGTLDAKVASLGYTAAKWYPKGSYEGTHQDTKGYDLPLVDDAAKGIGDPCRYYLGAPWRVPTATEWLALLGEDGNKTNKTIPLKVNGYDLSFPASGSRFYSGGPIDREGTHYCARSSSTSPQVTAGNVLYAYVAVFSKLSEGDEGALRHSAENRKTATPVRCVKPVL